MQSIQGKVIAPFLILLLELLAITSAFAESSILIVGSSKATVYNQVATNIQQTFEKQCEIDNSLSCQDTQIIRLSLDDLTRKLIDEHSADLIITLGKRAAERLQKLNVSTPKLYALIPKATYFNSLSSSSDQHTAVFLDQPIYRKVAIAKLLKKRPVLGFLLGKETGQFQANIAKSAVTMSVKAEFELVNDQSQLGPQVKELLKVCNVLIALPDASVYNKNTIFNILLSSYHNKTPLIGFSAAYVKAGALIAIYSTPKQIGTQLSEILHERIHAPHNELPPPMEAKYFSIAVNRNVSKSLGISLPSEDKIIDFIRRETP